MIQDTQSSITIRNVERGSCVMSTLSTTKITLHMLPRGNIEIACPLALNMPSCVKNTNTIEIQKQCMLLRIDINVISLKNDKRQINNKY